MLMPTSSTCCVSSRPHAPTLVTSTTKDIVMGSGAVSTRKGQYSLKGVPGRWALFAVDN